MNANVVTPLEDLKCILVKFTFKIKNRENLNFF